MHIRRYEEKDAAESLALFLGTVRAVNSKDYNPQQIRAWAPDTITLSDWQAAMNGKWGVVAEEAGTMTGFADLTEKGLLDKFYVHKDHQGRGAAGLLMAHVVNHARSLGLAGITAHVSITARPFFEHSGFTLVAAQDVHRHGQILRNFRMHMAITSDPATD